MKIEIGKMVAAVVVGLLLGLGSAYVVSHGRLSALEDARGTQKEQSADHEGRLRSQSETLSDHEVRLRALEAAAGTLADAAATVGGRTPLNVDEVRAATTAREPLRLEGEILKVYWNDPGNMVVQVYMQGQPIWPSDVQEENSAGVEVALRPGTYEVKLWVPGASSEYKSVWVQMISRQ